MYYTIHQQLSNYPFSKISSCSRQKYVPSKSNRSQVRAGTNLNNKTNGPRKWCVWTVHMLRNRCPAASFFGLSCSGNKSVWMWSSICQKEEREKKVVGRILGPVGRDLSLNFLLKMLYCVINGGKSCLSRQKDFPLFGLLEMAIQMCPRVCVSN